MLSSQELANRLVMACLKDQKIETNERIAVLVNGLGSTSREELYLLYNDMEKVFSSCGVQIAKTYIGEYVTSMEMAGISLSVMRMDRELEELIHTPAYSPFVTL